MQTFMTNPVPSVDQNSAAGNNDTPKEGNSNLMPKFGKEKPLQSLQVNLKELHAQQQMQKIEEQERLNASIKLAQELNNK